MKDMNRNKLIIVLLLALLGFGARGGEVSFTGNVLEVITETPPANTGLKALYVLHDLDGVSMHYTATTGNPVVWTSYGAQGGGFAQPVEGVTYDGLTSTLSNVEGDCGYIIEEGTTRTCVWVTDYSKHRLTLNGISADNDGDCSTATLHVDGSGTDIGYYTITGVRRTLSRDLKLSYQNLVWNEDEISYIRVDTTETEESFKPTIVIPAPLCNTTFRLSGDRFMEHWGEGKTVESDLYSTSAVEVHAIATQAERDNDNEKSTSSEGTLGGSAPVDITFEAHVTEAVVHYEWQMALDPEFENIQLRLNQEVVEQTFTDAGTYYWRFIGSNVDGSCESPSETFTVGIGVSEIHCPNIFTPGTSPGANDIWKVSYSSIVDFHCWIFNRWGNQICEFTDPSQGWDGRYRGKLVGPGVYYYVIQARGSDGKNYKLSGDINIIRYKDRGASTGGGTTGGDEPDIPTDE